MFQGTDAEWVRTKNHPVRKKQNLNPGYAGQRHHRHHRRGIGSRLLGELIERARKLGHHAIIAGIDADQPASVALHAKFRFEPAGHLKQVGFKFGRRLDVVYMELILDGASKTE